MTSVRIDGDVNGGDWVMRYRLQFVRDTIMERRPIAAVPDAEGVFFVDCGTPFRPGPSMAAFYIGGQWLTAKRQPFKAALTHWTRMVEAPVG